MKNKKLAKHRKKRRKSPPEWLGKLPLPPPPLPSSLQIPADRVNEFVTMVTSILNDDVAHLPLTKAQKAEHAKQMKKIVIQSIMPNIIPPENTQ